MASPSAKSSGSPAAAQRRRLLFVDDEPNVISGLRRMLHKHSDAWDMQFMTNAAEALERVGRESFDVVVSDMRMPGMDGGTFLAKVAAQCPQTVRFILSGNSEFHLICKSVGSAHQCLAKPCSYETLVNAINRSFRMGDALRDKILKTLVSQIGSLPSISAIYQEIMAEMGSGDPSVKRIGEIISRDIAMSAKVLQLVNSAFFGLATHVESPQHAAVLLGINTLKSLVMAVHIFHQAGFEDHAGLSIDKLSEHSIDVGMSAQKIGRLIGLNDTEVQDVFMAGLFHDIGKLILAAKLPAYRDIILHCRKKACSMYRAEAEKLGVSHSQVGAYLLSLWGFQGSILEAVLYHHRPNESHETAANVLTAIHVANAMMNEIDPPDRDILTEPADQTYLEKKGLSDILPECRKICRDYKINACKVTQSEGL
ncbi:MAG: HDOD domain-containing protein [Planctomycetes bacterium]|nr:HDOD domain-containing protein [Planctomycetota bacterium]